MGKSGGNCAVTKLWVPGARVASSTGLGRGSAADFATFLHALLAAQDDVAELSESGGSFEVRQLSWKLMADVADHHPACTQVLAGLVEGLAAGCGRHIPVRLRSDRGNRPPLVWSIG